MMKIANSTSLIAGAIPPLPKELLICLINLYFVEAESIEKKHRLQVHGDKELLQVITKPHAISYPQKQPLTSSFYLLLLLHEQGT